MGNFLKDNNKNKKCPLFCDTNIKTSSKLDIFVNDSIIFNCVIQAESLLSLEISGFCSFIDYYLSIHWLFTNVIQLYYSSEKTKRKCYYNIYLSNFISIIRNYWYYMFRKHKGIWYNIFVIVKSQVHFEINEIFTSFFFKSI